MKLNADNFSEIVFYQWQDTSRKFMDSNTFFVKRLENDLIYLPKRNEQDIFVEPPSLKKLKMLGKRNLFIKC